MCEGAALYPPQQATWPQQATCPQQATWDSSRAREPVPVLAVRRLMLGDFRNYQRLVLEVDAAPVVLSGPNGAGKTNLLEALSLLSSGRGCGMQGWRR